MTERIKGIKYKSDVPPSGTAHFKRNEYEGMDYSGKLMEFFGDIASAHQFSTTWSIYDTRDFTEVVHRGVVAVHYHGGWGKAGTLELTDPTWLDLWDAANELIEESTDTHHIFIESFELKGDTFHILCGS